MKKEEVESINRTGDFLHQAFCVEGQTKFVKYTQPEKGFNCLGMMYQIEDKKRGLFYVAIYQPVQ